MKHLKHRILLPLGLCGLAVSLSAFGAAARQSDPTNDKPDNSSPLADGLDLLQKMASSNGKVKQVEPAVETILKRCAGDPDAKDQTPTASEKQLAQVFRIGDGGKTDGGKTDGGKKDPHNNSDNFKDRGLPSGGMVTKINAFNVVLSKMPGIRSQPKFAAGARKTPIGRSIGFVRMTIDERSETIADIPTSSGSLTVSKRAAIIQERMKALQIADPLWWTHLKAEQRNGEWVVAAPAAKGGYIMTADAQFARLRNCTPAQLSEDLIVNIRHTFDPDKNNDLVMRSILMQAEHPRIGIRGGGPAQTRDIKLTRKVAVHFVQEGDAAFTRKQYEQAITKYKHAIDLQKDFVVARQSLGGVYLEMGRKAEARQEFERALQCQGIDESQKAETQAMLDKAK